MADALSLVAKIQRLRRLQAEHAHRPAPSTDLLSLTTCELVPALMPGFVAPYHLGPVADAIERSYHEQVKVVIAAPPQHGKTELITAALVKRLLDPGRGGRSAYVTYNQDRANEVSLQTQWKADVANLVWAGNLKHWGRVRGANVRWTSIGGSLTGSPIDDVLILDDPFKDNAEASSPALRDKKWRWWTSVALTRMHPGASAIVVATRWNEDDISGRLIDKGWQYINLQAIDDETGNVLWPEHRPRDFLDEQRREGGEHDWAALWQGRPQPRGAAVFGEPTFYTSLPRTLRYGHGADLAYTAKTSADFSVIVTMAMVRKRFHREGRWIELPVFHVIDVARKQVDAPSFLMTMLAQHTLKPGPIIFRASGTEKGSSQFIRRRLKSFRHVTARGDKFVASQEYAAAWNDDRVLVPDPEAYGAPWLAEFLAEHQRFTGVNDARDDQVDAGGNAHYALTRGGSSGSRTQRRGLPKRRM